MARRRCWTSLVVGLLMGGLVPDVSVASDRCVARFDPPMQSRGAHGGGVETALHYLTDVRAAAHRCHDRVVFELERGPEDGSLGYRVEYRKGPLREDGRGRPVPVDGEAFLVVRLSPARDARLSGPDPGPTYHGPATIRPNGARHVVEVRRVGSFEGVVTWAIGLEEHRPFRAMVFESPTRLVVDVG